MPGPTCFWAPDLTTTALQGFGDLYEFRCRAADRVGNLEAYPSQPDARTYLAQGGEVQPPPPEVPSHLYDLKLALHLAPHSAATSCKSLPAISSRGDLVRSWPSPGTELDAFLVIFAYDSLATFDYGLDWPAEWGSASTQTCADFTIGNIYGSGDGMSLGWNSCKVRGEAQAFSPVAWTWMAPWTNGSIWITYNPTFGPDAGLGGYDCRGAEHARFHHPDSLFCAAVGTDPFEGAWCGASAMGCIRALFK